ncbi:MAG: DUF4266 domain-containing protein [Myxococcota bacterium]
MRRAAGLLGCLLLGIAAVGTFGCAKVKPWERDVLARPDMAWDPDPQEANLRNHIYWSKEASLPGGGAGGGGCGCN